MKNQIALWHEETKEKEKQEVLNTIPSHEVAFDYSPLPYCTIRVRADFETIINHILNCTTCKKIQTNETGSHS